jgi:hypothetical protein
MSRTTLLIFVSLLTLPAISFAGHDPWRINATQHNWAIYYAETAVSQARNALRLGCGYAGARWTSHYRPHYDWALRKPRRSGEVEIDRRAHALEECRLRYGRFGNHYRHDGYQDRAWDRDRPGFNRDRDRGRRGRGHGRG